MANKRTPEPTGSWQKILEAQDRPRSSWNWADAEMLLDALVSVTEDGAALLLSVTTDGGALVMQVWSGTSRHKFYPASSSELNEMLAALAGRSHV